MTTLTAATRTDPLGPREWLIDDDIIQLREWGSERTYRLPRDPEGEWLVGAAPTCTIQLVDSWHLVSRHHARLVRGHGGWVIYDAGSKNGLWLDNGRRLAIGLSPGLEVGIGSLTLIAESERLIALRALLSRLLGWSEERRPIVDRALRSIRMAAMLESPLVVCGDGNLVDLACQIHRSAFGPDRPFIVCDPRRRRPVATSRSAESRTTLREAMQAARSGTICVWASRLPEDFEKYREQLADRAVRARLFVCYREPEQPPEPMPGIVRIPPLSERARELDMIMDAYAADVLTALGRGATESAITPHEREWLRHRRPSSIAELARAVERIVAIRELGSIERAAQWLGISRVALSRWLARRR